MKTLIKILAIAVATCAVSAYAVPTLTLFDGTSTVTITDGGAGDTCPNAGCVTWIGAIGVWNLNIDTGFTKPLIGGPTNLKMDLAFAALSNAAGMLTITFSDDGYTVNGGGIDAIGGTTAFNNVVDNILINGGVVMTQGPFGPGAFSGTTTGNITLNPADLIALQVVIGHSGAGMTTGDKSLQVPEGGSAVALLGMALVGLEGLRRKIRARKS